MCAAQAIDFPERHITDGGGNHIRRLISLHSVAFTGSLMGVASLLPGWLTLRPNRLAAGTSLSAWDSFGFGAISLGVLWMACLALSLLKWRRRGPALGIIVNVILVLTVLLVGYGSRQFLADETEVARVSLSAGVWFTIAAVYVVLFASYQSFRQDERVWQAVVSWSGLVVVIAVLASGWLDRLSIMVEFGGYRSRFWQEALQHVRLSAISVSAATVIGVLLGVWATRSRVAEKPVFFITNIMQTVPSVALFGLLIPPLSAISFAFPALRDAGIRGIGATPAILALTLYSLLPVLQNTYTGIRQIDRGALDAGRGMGMTGRQLLWRVEIPLAAPLVLEGIRTASVQAVGLTAVAALIGAGGLGWFVFRGMGQAAPDLILLGAIPIIVLAFGVDGVMRWAVRLGTPRALKAQI